MQQPAGHSSSLRQLFGASRLTSSRTCEAHEAICLFLVFCADGEGKTVKSQLLPVSNATVDLQQAMLAADILPNLRSAASHELAFIADVPSLGYATYTISAAKKEASAEAESAQPSALRSALGIKVCFGCRGGGDLSCMFLMRSFRGVYVYCHACKLLWVDISSLTKRASSSANLLLHLCFVMLAGQSATILQVSVGQRAAAAELLFYPHLQPSQARF